ncbi:MAG: hypothetical protein ACUVQF_04085 [Fervidobacterium sp.]|uniref:hypothetical protein n=1 Tax=Fervidobacterium sp. TaxID=1871331 RepID=UPI00404A3663
MHRQYAVIRLCGLADNEFEQFDRELRALLEKFGCSSEPNYSLIAEWVPDSILEKWKKTYGLVEEEIKHIWYLIDDSLSNMIEESIKYGLEADNADEY